MLWSLCKSSSEKSIWSKWQLDTQIHIDIYIYVCTYVVLLAHTDTCAYIFLFALEFDNTLWPVNPNGGFYILSMVLCYLLILQIFNLSSVCIAYIFMHTHVHTHTCMYTCIYQSFFSSSTTTKIHTVCLKGILKQAL